MKTTPVMAGALVSTVRDTTVSYLPGAAQRATIDAPLSRLRRALAQVDDLKRALVSSQRESAAAHKQLDILTQANARLGSHAGPHPVARCAARYPAWEPGDLSLTAGLDPDEMSYFGRFMTKRSRFRKGDAVYRAGDRFDMLFAIRTGSCKAVLLARDGQEQITGYHMTGEVIGMDGIGSGLHECQATALEDMEVCALPFDRVDNFARFSDQFRHNLQRLLSQECSRVQTLMLVLGSMRAEKRLAVFLLDLSQRYRARGFSPSEFVLRMTREEIGSYLGLKLETVSRQLAHFQREGLIQVQGRLVELLDRGALDRLAGCGV